MASAIILLADDNREMPSMVQRVLRPEYTLLETVENGQVVLDRVPVLKPDVLLLDISMPVMDGLTCARRLRELSPMTRIIFLTDYDDLEYFHEAQAIGFQGYVLKSHLASDLNIAIQEALKNRVFISSSDELKDSS